MGDINSYIIQFETETQRRLMSIRSIALDIFQTAEEKMYHGIPTFFKGKNDILNYGAYKDHITIYVGYELVELLEKTYPQYEYTKAAIKIPNCESFPEDLVEEICELVNGSS